MLILHIIIALASLAVSTAAFIVPTHHGLLLAYSLIAGTLASGLALMLFTHASTLQACLSGLAYSAAVSTLSYLTKRKLAHQP